jgi:hypothetical protein
MSRTREASVDVKNAEKIVGDDLNVDGVKPFPTLVFFGELSICR